MYNFNNKIGTPELAKRCQTSPHEHTILTQNTQKQQNATQFLLHISEIQNQSNKKISNFDDDMFEVAEVTPWENIKFNRNKQGCYARSKTSMILPPCVKTKIIKENKIFKKSNNYNQQNKENITSKQKLVKVDKQFSTQKKKNPSQVKSSYSTIARYIEKNSDVKNLPLQEFPEVKYSNCSSIVYINCEENQEQNKKDQRHKKNYHQQHHEPNRITLMIPKIGNTSNKRINTLNDQILYPITRERQRQKQKQNNLTKILKTVQSNCEQLKKKKNQVRQFTTREEEQKIHNQTKSKENNKQNNFVKLKNSILQRIQKESVVCLSMSTQNKNPRKKLQVKYLRGSHQKNHKILKKNDIINSSYEANNPITKQLYQKYKKLISGYQ